MQSLSELSYREFDTDRGEFIFPTTTPIHFDPVEAHRAIDRIMATGPEQLFLTHYSRILDLERLAADMHRGIDDFVELATNHARDEDRTASMQRSMFDYFLSRLEEHDYAGSRDDAWKLLAPDVMLNTQGLEYWLDHAGNQ